MIVSLQVMQKTVPDLRELNKNYLYASIGHTKVIIKVWATKGLPRPKVGNLQKGYAQLKNFRACVVTLHSHEKNQLLKLSTSSFAVIS